METKKLLKLTIGGKAYPCRVTMGAMTRFKHECGKDVSKMDQGDIGELVLFIYCCVKSACNADGVAFDMDFETFADHLEPESVNAFYASSGESDEKNISASSSEASIEELAGIGMGCIGMSLDDFERCTPSEFYAAWKQWHEQMERMERSSWERTRTLALVYVQPYSKHALSAHELLPLPWDEESKEEKSKPDRAETVRRYAAAKQRNGLK